jgi:hypothetical protein
MACDVPIEVFDQAFEVTLQGDKVSSSQPLSNGQPFRCLQLPDATIKIIAHAGGRPWRRNSSILRMT